MLIGQSRCRYVGQGPSFPSVSHLLACSACFIWQPQWKGPGVYIERVLKVKSKKAADKHKNMSLSDVFLGLTFDNSLYQNTYLFQTILINIIKK